MTATTFAQGSLKLSRVHEFYGNTLALLALGLAFNPELRSAWELLQLFAANLLLTLFAFAINDIEDAEDDRQDAHKALRNPLCSGELSPRAAAALTWVSAALGLVLLAPFGPLPLALGVGDVLLGFLYSYKPVRLKGRPFVDLLSHGLFLGTLQFLIVATAHHAPLTPQALLAAGLVFVISVAGDLWNELRDFEVDRKTQLRNTASVLDVRRLTAWLPYLFALPFAALVLLVLTQVTPEQAWVLGICAVLLALAFLGRSSEGKRALVTAQAQHVEALVGALLLLCLTSPWLR